MPGCRGCVLGLDWTAWSCLVMAICPPWPPLLTLPARPLGDGMPQSPIRRCLQSGFDRSGQPLCCCCAGVLLGDAPLLVGPLSGDGIGCHTRSPHPSHPMRNAQVAAGWPPSRNRWTSAGDFAQSVVFQRPNREPREGNEGKWGKLGIWESDASATQATPHERDRGICNICQHGNAHMQLDNRMDGLRGVLRSLDPSPHRLTDSASVCSASPDSHGPAAFVSLGSSLAACSWPLAHRLPAP